MNSIDAKHHPELVSPKAWIAATATVVGDVHLAEKSSVWYGAVLRGDCERIEVGIETNVQDLCCLHADPGQPCQLGDHVTVGHGAIVHGAIVDCDTLIGMRSVILDGARIGRNCIVGAGAVVTQGKVIPPRSLVLGTPGKVVREVSENEIEMILRSAQHYVEAANAFSLAQHGS